MNKLGISYYNNDDEVKYKCFLNKEDFEQNTNKDIGFILANMKNNELMTAEKEYELSKCIFNNRQNIYKLLMAFKETEDFFVQCSQRTFFDFHNNNIMSKDKFKRLSVKIKSFRKKINLSRCEKTIEKYLFDFYKGLKIYEDYYGKIKISELYNEIEKNVKKHNSVLRKIFPQLKQSYNDYLKNVNFFCNSNLRMVISIAKPFFKTNTHIPQSDIIQFGNEGLIKAVHKFDYRKKIKFSTYGTYWIRQSIMRQTDAYKLIHIPANQVTETRKISKLLEQETKISGNVDLEKFSSKYKIPLNKIIGSRLVYATYYNPSVDIHAQENEDSSTILDLISLNELQVNQYDVYKNKEAIKNLIKYAKLTGIEKRDIDIVCMRYGIYFINNRINYSVDGQNDGEKEHMYTLDEVGKKFGISRERVRQLENRFFKMIRKSRFANRLKAYVSDVC